MVWSKVENGGNTLKPATHMMSEYPYTDLPTVGNSFVRQFDHSVPTEELVWHRDRKDRLVTVKEGSGWCMQFDNQLPQTLCVGDTVFVPKNTYHRLHKGHGNLTVHIQEFTCESHDSYQSQQEKNT